MNRSWLTLSLILLHEQQNMTEQWKEMKDENMITHIAKYVQSNQRGTGLSGLGYKVWCPLTAAATC